MKFGAEVVLSLASRKFQQGVKKAERSAKNLRDKLDKVDKKGKKTGKTITKVGTSSSKAAKGVKSMSMALHPATIAIGATAAAATATAAAIAGLTAVTVKATMQFTEYERAMSRVDALMAGSPGRATKYTASMKRIQKEFGVTGIEAARALYSVQSLGWGDDAEEVLNAAGMLKLADGLITFTEATKLMSEAARGAGVETEDLTYISAALFRAVQDGASDLSGYASALGQIVPVARLAGMEFQTVTDTLAFFTAQQVPIRQAATQMSAAFRYLASSTEQQRKKFKDIVGVDLSAKVLKDNQSLLNFLKEINAATQGGELDLLGKLDIPDEALRFFAVTAGPGMENFEAAINKSSDAIGNLEEAVLRAQGTFYHQIDKISEAWSTGMNELGKNSADVILDIIEGFGGIKEVTTTISEAFTIMGVSIRAVGAIAPQAYDKLAAASAVYKEFITNASDTALLNIPKPLRAISSLFEGEEEPESFDWLKALSATADKASKVVVESYKKVKEQQAKESEQLEEQRKEETKNANAMLLELEKAFIAEEEAIFKESYDDRKSILDDFQDAVIASARATSSEQKRELQQQERDYEHYVNRIRSLEEQRARFNETIEDRIFALRMRGQTPDQNITSLMSAAREFESRAGRAATGDEARRLLEKAASFIEQVANVDPDDLGLQDAMAQELESIAMKVNRIFGQEIGANQTSAEIAAGLIEESRQSIAEMGKVIERLAALGKLTLDPNIDPFAAKLDYLERRLINLNALINQATATSFGGSGVSSTSSSYSVGDINVAYSPREGAGTDVPGLARELQRQIKRGMIDWTV